MLAVTFGVPEFRDSRYTSTTGLHKTSMDQHHTLSCYTFINGLNQTCLMPEFHSQLLPQVVTDKALRDERHSFAMRRSSSDHRHPGVFLRSLTGIRRWISVPIFSRADVLLCYSGDESLAERNRRIEPRAG
jgi:hypothetical protein